MVCIQSLSYHTYKVAVKKKVKYENEKRASNDIIQKWKSFVASENAGESKGMERLKLLIKCLTILDKKYPRSRHQLEFHKAFISANLVNILGKDLHPNITKIIETYGIDDIKLDIIIDTPRRFGKTTGVAQFVAAFLYSQPGKSVSIYSTCKRASVSILDKIKEMLVIIHGDSTCFIASNQEVIKVNCQQGGQTECHSYPSSVDIDIIFFYLICDEREGIRMHFYFH